MKLQVVIIISLTMYISQVSTQGAGDWAGDDYVDHDDSAGDQTTNPTCGSNCGTSKNCPSCPCGSIPSKVDPKEWCKKFNQWNQGCCICIVTQESHGNTNAMNWNKPRTLNGKIVKNGTFDVGLWQINQINFGSCNKGKIPCDVTENLNCAAAVWK